MQRLGMTSDARGGLVDLEAWTLHHFEAPFRHYSPPPTPRYILFVTIFAIEILPR